MPSGEFDINDYNMGPTGMFNAGESLNEHFEAVRMLSEGAHAEVYEVFNHADNSPYVAKVPKNSGSSGQFSREASILKTLAQHRTPHSLIRAHPATEHRGQAILILEYLKGPTLKEHLAQKGGQLSVKESTGIIRDLLEALSALHGAGIAHGDVKPENIKILDRGAVLFDFSISQHVGDKEDVRSLGGSGHFKPPEKELTPAWDIFSTGVLLHLLIRGRLPQWDLGGS
ncbi:MAG: serine/threonine protein kinase, partial [Coraliomargarita sp.]